MKNRSNSFARGKLALGKRDAGSNCSVRGPGLVPAMGMALLFVASTAGCASWRQKIVEPGVSQTREERAANAVREFEDRRDTAQLAAAMERFEQDDTDRAEAMLAALVKRRPGLTAAHLRLAEILWSKSDPTAESHLRMVIERDAANAEAHHTLGLVLAATDRPSEAREHVQRACELEPTNEVFQVTFDSLEEVAAR